MNSTSSHPTKHHHQSCVGSPHSVSSTAPDASIEALKDKISALDMLRAQTASQCIYPSTALSSSTSDANANAVEGNDLQTRRILQTNCESSNKGPTLDPASCASVLARIGGGGGDRSRSTAADANAGSRKRTDADMQTRRILQKNCENRKTGPNLNPASCASGLALIVGGVGGEGSDCDGVQDQGNTHRRNSLLQNEDWGDLQYPQGLVNLFLGNGDI